MSVHITVYSCMVHDSTQNSSNNLPSYPPEAADWWVANMAVKKQQYRRHGVIIIIIIIMRHARLALSSQLNSHQTSHTHTHLHVSSPSLIHAVGSHRFGPEGQRRLSRLPPRRRPPPRANSLMTGAPVHQTCTRRSHVLGIADRRALLPDDVFVSGPAPRWNRWL